MDDGFQKNRLAESSTFSFLLKGVGFVVIIILTTGVWIGLDWLSPYKATSEYGVITQSPSPANKQIIPVVKKSTLQTYPSSTESSPTVVPQVTNQQETLTAKTIVSTESGNNNRSKKTLPADKEIESSLLDGSEGVSISGMVLDEIGNPIHDIDITALWNNYSIEDRKMEVPRGKQQTVTEFDGYYQFQGLEEGEYVIHNKASKHYQPASIVVRAGVESADLILRKKQPDIHIAGSIQSQGKPLKSVRVVPTGQSKNAVYTDEKGRYQLSIDINSRLKMYTVHFSHQDYQAQSSEFNTDEMLKLRKIHLDLELEPIDEWVEVSGNLRSSDGSSVPEEKVQLYSKTTKRSYFAVSNGDGTFWFPKIELASDYFLSVHPIAYYQDYLQKDIQITSSGKKVDIVLEPLKLGNLSGKIVDPKGNPIADFSLWLHNNDASSFPAKKVFSDSHGIFNLSEIPEGKLVFDTRSSPIFSITGIHQSAGEKNNVKLVLDWGSHNVQGRIVNSQSNPVPAAEISLTWFRRSGKIRSYSTRKAITDNHGYFFFSKVGPGIHSIRIGIPGYVYTQQDYDVGSSTTDILIRLKKV